MKYNITYLIDQQVSARLEVQTIGVESSYQPIYVIDGNGEPLRLSYDQALDMIEALKVAVGEIEGDQMVPPLNVEHPGAVISVDQGKGAVKRCRERVSSRNVVDFRKKDK